VPTILNLMDTIPNRSAMSGFLFRAARTDTVER
jgi:hypothetical protein